MPNEATLITITETGGLKRPAPSIAERKPARSSRGHSSGSMTVLSDDGYRVLYYESKLERCCATIMDASPAILRIHEQVAFGWFDRGAARTHYFDFVVTKKSGGRAALIVKPTKRAHKPAFLKEVREISEQAVQIGVVEEVFVYTDESFSDVQLRNAELIRSVREVDIEADRVVADLIKGLQGNVRIQELVAASRLEARGFRAVVRQIGTGSLEYDEGVSISRSLEVAKSRECNT